MEIQEVVATFESQRPRYKEYAEFLEKVLKVLVEQVNPLCLVGARAKKTVSFADKAILKKDKYDGRPLEHMTDLVGARVITNTQQDVQDVCKIIEELFEINWEDSADSALKLRTEEFGYRSVHYIVRVPEGATDILGVTVPPKPDPATGSKAAEYVLGILVKPMPDNASEDISGLWAEIQVRTMLEHAWADIGHDRFYKSAYEAPAALRRKLSACAAAIEETDRGLDDLCTTVVTQFENYGIHRTEEQWKEQKRRYKDMLDVLEELAEDDIDSICGYSLRLAQLHEAVGNRQKISEVLQPRVEEIDKYLEAHKGDISRSVPQYKTFRQIWALYGNACVYKKKSNYALARNFLQLAERNRPAPGETTGPEAKDRIQAQSLIDQGRLKQLARKPSPSKVFEYYQKALDLDPENPYILSCVLSAYLPVDESISTSGMMGAMLLSGVEMCKTHISVGVCPRWVYFTMGRLLMMAGKHHDAYGAYCRGHRFYYENSYLEAKRYYDAEIKFAQSVITANKKSPPPAYVHLRQLLKLLRDSYQSIDPEDSKPVHPEEQYVIVTGQSERELPDKTREQLLDALRQLQDVTIYSGGTKKGVCGVVGELDPKTFDLPIETQGYMPKHYSKLRDKRYTQKPVTVGSQLSIRQSLKMWTDLLKKKKVDPRNICVLGIGGGEISVFEYQLAAVLGARVTVLLPKQRDKSNDLADDDLWVDVPNIGFLRYREPQTLLLAACPPPPTAADMQIESMAQASHEDHNIVAPPKPDDPARAQWKNLTSDLKMSNELQVRYIHLHLRTVGYQVVKMSKKDKKPLTKLLNRKKGLPESEQEDKTHSINNALEKVLIPDFLHPPENGNRDAEDKLLWKHMLEPEELALAEQGKLRKPNDPPETHWDRLTTIGIQEHARWVVERLTAGWHYAEEKDAKKKLSPCLVPWDKLDYKFTNYDKLALVGLAKTMRDNGFIIVTNEEAERRKLAEE
jgi:ppGpp synthetase/RelA/SpoT-type nucleotidyltranferase